MCLCASVCVCADNCVCVFVEMNRNTFLVDSISVDDFDDFMVSMFGILIFKRNYDSDYPHSNGTV